MREHRILHHKGSGSHLNYDMNVRMSHWIHSLTAWLWLRLAVCILCIIAVAPAVSSGQVRTERAVAATCVPTASHPCADSPHADDPGPAPSKCNAYAPVMPCYYTPGFMGFSLSRHILRIGDTLTGKMSWDFPNKGRGEYPANFSVTLVAGGRGLTFLGCRGPQYVHNLAVKPIAGSTTCTWKAIAPSGGWSVDLGAVLGATGSGAYKGGDFYVVLGKDVHAIEGRVRDSMGTTLAGVHMAISGVGGVQTNSDGYYYRFVRTGSYNVQVVGPRPKDYKPSAKKVVVREADTSTVVDFEGKIHTELIVSKTSVSDSGTDQLHIKIYALDPVNQPVANYPLLIYVGPSEQQSATALVCDPHAPGHVEPAILSRNLIQFPGGLYRTTGRDNLNERFLELFWARHVRTDSKGYAADWTVYVGTIAGALDVRVSDGTKARPPSDTADDLNFEKITVTQGRDTNRLPNQATFSLPLHTSGHSGFTLAQMLTALTQGKVHGASTPLSLDGSAGDVQKAMLLAIEKSHLLDGYGLAPIYVTSGLLRKTKVGVLIYVRGTNARAEYGVVWDRDTARAMLTENAATTQITLPTRGEWEIEPNTTFIDETMGYATAEPEQGLTYVGGLPYLPTDPSDQFVPNCTNTAVSPF